jgi:tRNA (guanine26-N2/guanine27-N2)-dimethyltransferase
MIAVSLRSAILNAGYKVSLSHACRTALKTNAPADVLWDIMRCWEKQNPANRDKLDPATHAAALKLLSKEPGLAADFTKREEANPESRKLGLTRFPENPARFWGPKSRAKTGYVRPTVTSDRTRSRF